MSADSSERAAPPVFLLSSERSGSNLVRSILNTHSEICAPHPFETAFPREHVADLADLGDRTLRALVRDVLINKHYSYHPLTVPLRIDRVYERVRESPSFAGLQEALYEECLAQEEKSMWVSKYPGLWDVLDDLLNYHAAARIVYLVRDPRDVVLSFKTSNIDLYHPYFSARRWRTEQRRGIELLDDLDDAIHLVRYEDLLRDPEDEVESMCSFLDVPYEEAMLYYYETEDARATSESSELFENLSVPIKRDNYGKFRDSLPDAEVKLTEALVRDELERFGYDRVYSTAELDAFEPDPEATYRREDRRLERRARRRYWREDPGEQVKRHLTKSFTAYMALRYGLLAGIG